MQKIEDKPRQRRPRPWYKDRGTYVDMRMGESFQAQGEAARASRRAMKEENAAERELRTIPEGDPKAEEVHNRMLFFREQSIAAYNAALYHAPTMGHA